MSLQSIDPTEQVVKLSRTNHAQHAPGNNVIIIGGLTLRFLELYKQIHQENNDKNQQFFITHPDAIQCLRLLFQFKQYVMGYPHTDKL